MSCDLFSERLRQLRIEKNMTQNELADQLACNRQKVADLERGKSSPSINDLITISSIFGVSGDYLLGLSEVKTSDKDIQFICDYTGLDEHAIKQLRFRLNTKLFGDDSVKERINVLNLFIDDCYLDRILDFATSYKYDLITIKKIYENYLKQERKSCFEILNSTTEIEDSLDLTKFRLQELNKNFIKEYTKKLQEEVDYYEKIIRQEIADSFEKIISQEELALREQQGGDTDGNNPQT